jgi:hypothetical protein
VALGSIALHAIWETMDLGAIALDGTDPEILTGWISLIFLVLAGTSFLPLFSAFRIWRLVHLLTIPSFITSSIHVYYLGDFSESGAFFVLVFPILLGYLSLLITWIQFSNPFFDIAALFLVFHN